MSSMSAEQVFQNVRDNLKKGARFVKKMIPGTTTDVITPEFTLQDVKITTLSSEWISPVVRTFASWGKTEAQFNRYLAEQVRGERVVLVAHVDNVVVGYCTIISMSPHNPLAQHIIPELMDLNVYSKFQNKGIGAQIIKAAESWAEDHGMPVLGISVIQTPQYATANYLYPKLGYILLDTSPEDNKIHFVKALSSDVRKVMN